MVAVKSQHLGVEIYLSNWYSYYTTKACPKNWRGNTITVDKRETFLRAFSNLPLQSRKEIILVLEEGPITWEVAYLEVRNNTEKSKVILNKLEALRLI